MATDMGRGIMAPNADDNISSTGVNEIRTVAATAASAIGHALQEASAEIDSKVYRRGQVTADTNWDNIKTPGAYYTGGPGLVASQRNLGVLAPSDVIVGGNGSTIVTQLQLVYGDEFAVYFRAIARGGVDWLDWERIAFSSEIFEQGTVPPDTNWDNVRRPAMYYTGGAFNVSGQSGLAVNHPSSVLVGGNGGSVTTQTQIVYGGEFAMYYRASRDGAGNFWPWQKIPTMDDIGSGGGGAAPLFGAGTPNPLRLQVFKDEYPLVSTEGKGVVTFRYAHGLTNFKQHILPIHQAADIPVNIAMNSRLWDIPENSGASQAEARAWTQSGLVTWSNHTGDHEDKPDAAGIFDNIVTAREELEAQLGVTIHGFTLPGVTQYDRFGGLNGANLDELTGTYAGELILANHAITTGQVGAVRRPLDGVIRQGNRHQTWERQGFATIKSWIDAAIDTKTAITLMSHPRILNEGGTAYTTSLVQQVVDYVRSQIDAGNLANIDYYQSHHATL